ncbi:MAG: histidine--tRNA ligase [Candidatus Micrarchaeota archaeon]|nr:histidine--tRNA ligase [Candidatus Micrarchaeota archaeon]
MNTTKNNSSADTREVKGTREYMPSEQIVRERIVDVLKQNFKLYGYGPIETSILENYEVAASKYGGGSEILKETYRLTDQGQRELCLRYELTFKFAKLIEMNPNVRLPFKRYEIGKVFRDGPVKLGRLREFTQCDVDVVGAKSLSTDAELIDMTFRVFGKLGLDVNVQLNNRKLLFGIFEQSGIAPEQCGDAALSLDKIVKFGEDYVKKELIEKGVSEESAIRLFDTLAAIEMQKGIKEKLSFLSGMITNETGKKGISELQEIFGYCANMGVSGDLRFAPTLARGLGYYTGPMWEVYLNGNSKMTSSLAAGGRWDKMVQEFMKSEQEYPATGMTFGLDVIYAALEEKKGAMFDSKQERIPMVLIIPMNTLGVSLEVAANLRRNGISCDVAADKKLTKALDYANKQSVPYVAIVGEKELKDNKVNIKDMDSGKEQPYNLSTIGADLRVALRSVEQSHHS